MQAFLRKVRSLPFYQAHAKHRSSSSSLFLPAQCQGGQIQLLQKCDSRPRFHAARIRDNRNISFFGFPFCYFVLFRFSLFRLFFFFLVSLLSFFGSPVFSPSLKIASS